MSYNARRILTPQASRKRKEMEVFPPTTSSKPLVPPTSVSRAVSRPSPATTSFKGAEQQPLSSNKLLAGYMAYEFLTKGTLFGQKFDPARAEAAPVSSADLKRSRQSQNQNQNQSQSHSQPTMEAEPSGKSKPESYAEVANLLKSDGAHVPGVVNPTMLARWIQM